MKLTIFQNRYTGGIFLLFIFISSITLGYTYFEVPPQEWRESWPYILLLIAFFFFLLPWSGGMLLFGKMKKTMEQQRLEDLERQIQAYSGRVSLFILISSSIWFISFILPDYLRMEMTALDRTNILVTLFYINLVFPGFMVYMVNNRIQSDMKRELHRTMDMVFHPSGAKIRRDLMLFVIITSFFPMAILFLDVLGFYNPQEDEGYLIFGMIDLLLFSFSILLGLGVIIRSITGPIHSLLNSFNRLKQGDFSSRVPVSEKGELGQLTFDYNVMAEELEQREKVKETFGQYVSPVIAQQILQREEALNGEEREVTILFTDIESYTSITEDLSPRQTIALMNDYYSELIPLVQKYQGTVNKFMGDALMVLFNAPNDDPHHGINAVKCAREIASITESRLFEGGKRLKTRVGINTGPVMAGRLGGTGRYEYTVLGDSVNLAQRLEAMNKKTGTPLLMNSTTARLVHRDMPTRYVGTTQVKGKNRPVKIYTLAENG